MTDVIRACEPLKIGGVTLKNRFTLAPMAGYTDGAMRRLAAQAGAALTVTEMVSAKGLAYNGDKCAGLLVTSLEEQVTAVQLFGHEPEFFTEAIKNLPYLDKFDIIDINMGCPVPKIVKSGEGSALIKNPLLASKIVRACADAAGGRPVTVKTRVGFYDGEDVSVDFCRMLEDSGAAAITLHGRTRAMGYSGVSDWGAVERVKNSVSVPVIGSGDADENNALRLAGLADAVAVGRCAVGDPWIFSRILGGENRMGLCETVLTHIKYMFDMYGDRYTYTNIRKHIGSYLRGIRGGKELKAALYSVDGTNELIAAVKSALQGL